MWSHKWLRREYCDHRRDHTCDYSIHITSDHTHAHNLWSNLTSDPYSHLRSHIKVFTFDHRCAHSAWSQVWSQCDHKIFLLGMSLPQRGTFIIFIVNATTNWTLLTSSWQFTLACVGLPWGRNLQQKLWRLNWSDLFYSGLLFCNFTKHTDTFDFSCDHLIICTASWRANFKLGKVCGLPSCRVFRLLSYIPW